MVSAKEEPDATLPPAIDGLLRVHKRIVDGLDGDSAQAAAAPGGKVSTKLLVPATQAGSLIGKQGATVKTIQETSSCIVRVLGAGQSLGWIHHYCSNGLLLVKEEEEKAVKMIRRGGGKKPNSRSVIAPGRLQDMIRSTRINGCNTEDGGTLYRSFEG